MITLFRLRSDEGSYTRVSSPERDVEVYARGPLQLPKGRIREAELVRAIEQAGGGLFAEVGEGRLRVVVAQGADYSPPQYAVRVVAGVAPRAYAFPDEPTVGRGSHFIVPVDAATEEQLLKICDVIEPLPEDLRDLILHTICRPGFESRLSAIEQRLRMRGSAAPLLSRIRQRGIEIAALAACVAVIGISVAYAWWGWPPGTSAEEPDPPSTVRVPTSPEATQPPPLPGTGEGGPTEPPPEEHPDESEDRNAPPDPSPLSETAAQILNELKSSTKPPLSEAWTTFKRHYEDKYPGEPLPDQIDSAFVDEHMEDQFNNQVSWALMRAWVLVHAEAAPQDSDFKTAAAPWTPLKEALKSADRQEDDNQLLGMLGCWQDYDRSEGKQVLPGIVYTSETSPTLLFVPAETKCSDLDATKAAAAARRLLDDLKARVES